MMFGDSPGIRKLDSSEQAFGGLGKASGGAGWGGILIVWGGLKLLAFSFLAVPILTVRPLLAVHVKT